MNQPPFLDVVVTARPSWARVKTLCTSYAELAGAERIRLSLVGPAVSARYGDISDLVPKYISVNSHPTLRESDELASIALSCLDGSQSLVHQWSSSRPDCVLVVADRTETLGVSSAAALMQIPLIHLQGGEISGSIDDKVRDANSKLADLHLTTNAKTKKYLENIGESSRLIYVVGCPSIDLVKRVMLEPPPSFKDLGGVGADIDFGKKFGIIMFHPDTLELAQSNSWISAIIDAVGSSDFPWVWFWPNPDNGTNKVSKLIRSSRELGQLKNVKFIINIPPEKFIALAIQSAIIVGNSSFGIREASFIGLPSLNLGGRQSGRQRSMNVVDINSPDLKDLKFQIQRLSESRFKPSMIYGDGHAGKLAAEIIAEWLPTVKRRRG